MDVLSKQGVKVDKPVTTAYFGSLIAILADNLAAHLIGGFKQSMSFALRLCRTCMATTEQIQSKFLESDFVLRTPENHRKQCLKITSSAALYGHLSTNYRINRSSVLDNVLNFSVVTNLPHDIMHDMFEGVIPFELKLYLQHCVRHNYFTMTELNRRIRLFDYGYSELSSKTSEIDINVAKVGSEMKIRQSASQMYVFSLYLWLI